MQKNSTVYTLIFATVVCLFFSVIVSSPLKASSISASDPTMAAIKAFMYSHSCKKAF